MAWKQHCHLAPAFVAVVLWVLIGTFGYYFLGNCSTVPEFDGRGGIETVEYCPWTLAQCFYYSIQAGFSVGFGLLAETSDGSRLFTVIYVLAGTSFITGALVYFIEYSLTKQAEWMSKEEQRLATFSSHINADGFGGFNLKQLHELLICHPQHMRDICVRMDNDYRNVSDRMKLFSESGLAARARMVDEVLKEACEKLEEFRDHAVSIPALLSMRRHSAAQRCCSFLTLSVSKQVVAFGIWLILGILYIVVMEGQSFIVGLYFAVTSCSTGGLYAVTSMSNGAAYWFAGCYCLVGVPLFGVVIGSYANLLVEAIGASKVKDIIHRRMDRAEIAFLGHLVKAEHKEKADFSDYVEIQLLRLGLVDRSFLEQLRNNFDKLDLDEDGKVPLSHLLTASQQKCLEHERATTRGLEHESAATRGASSADPEDEFNIPSEMETEVEV